MGIVKWQESGDTSSSIASILSQLNALSYLALTMEPLYHHEETCILVTLASTATRHYRVTVTEVLCLC